MGSAATLVLAVFLLPTVAVFVLSYRHALRTWLAPRGQVELPVATVVRPGADGGAPTVSFAQRFHAAIIATAFASVFTMAMIALALVATAIAAA
jgi:hypothetical protein